MSQFAAGMPGDDEPINIPDDISELDADASDAPVEGQVEQPPISDTDRLQAELNERTEDLQRLAAEYQNYKRRVDRDRDVAKIKGIESVVADLLPVFDAIDQADNHDELTGGFKLVADELTKAAAKHGLELFGEVGDEFDPVYHEALMQVDQPGFSVTTIAQVIQRGARINDRVLRPARVAVAQPTETDQPEQ